MYRISLALSFKNINSHGHDCQIILFYFIFVPPSTSSSSFSCQSQRHTEKHSSTVASASEASRISREIWERADTAPMARLIFVPLIGIAY